MRRRVRWLVIVAVLVVLAVIAAGVLISPEIGDARDRVDARWTPLRSPLAARYEALAALTATMHDAGAGERAVTEELDEVLPRWEQLALKGPTHTDAGREARTANELEALARRLRANITGSDLLNGNATLTAALAAFDLAVVPEPTIAAYNRDVRRYEDERSGAIKAFIASIFGYDSRPLLVVGG
jgi:hypothetical protein